MGFKKRPGKEQAEDEREREGRRKEPGERMVL